MSDHASDSPTQLELAGHNPSLVGMTSSIQRLRRALLGTVAILILLVSGLLIIQWPAAADAILIRAVTGALAVATAAVVVGAGWLLWRPALAAMERGAAGLERANVELLALHRDAQAKNEERGHRLADISHALRTPLHTMLAAAGSAREGTESPRQRELLETMDDASRSLLTLLNDVLDMAAMDAGKLELQPEPTDVAELVRHTLGLFAQPAESKRLKLQCLIDDRLPARLVADEIRLRQVLFKLISNAVKFTDHGSVTVNVDSTERDERRADVRFAVHDTGIGIADDEQERIFDPFTQAGSAERGTEKKAGLGLAVSSRLVELMGGEIALTSELGQGSSFWFTLPLEIADPQPHDLAASSAASPKELSGQDSAEALQGLRVLAAEDVSINRRLLVELLTREGCQVTAASDGDEALSNFRRGRYDVVLLDVHMPGLDGPQVATAIRDLEEDRHEPAPLLLALTADGTDQCRKRCFDAGFDEVIMKPFEAEDLLSAMRELSDERRADEGRRSAK